MVLNADKVGKIIPNAFFDDEILLVFYRLGLLLSIDVA
ncbi:hypothetical protein LCGC14_0069750 [marine sediment metagenome]|uniref:Uncharacterized protein n=1 Tax=marine sediment metagenome TaxID=412755 RepID=A0A0F9W183_9ZZZZ